MLGKTFNEHLANLCEVFERMRQYGLKLKPQKCALFQRQIEFLGRILNGDSISMSQDHIRVVQSWPASKCSKDVERFLGLVNYHRTFMPDFAQIATPLYALTEKGKFLWANIQQRAFERLKECLTTPPVLTLPNGSDPFILVTDASD